MPGNCDKFTTGPAGNLSHSLEKMLLSVEGMVYLSSIAVSLQQKKRSPASMAKTEENNLLARLKADDRSALRDLFNHHYSMVCQAIFRFVRDESTTEDLAQEVFLRFWEKRHKIEVTSSLQAYLRRMAVNEGLGHLRKMKRWDQGAFDPGLETGNDRSAEEHYLHGELEDNITNAINGLPPRCRAVFQLSRFEELTYQEIADQMGISVKTVENQMGKALKVLRERLQQYLHLIL